MHSGRSILLVEDDPDDAFFFKRQIDALGRFQVYLVEDARRAIRFLEDAHSEGWMPAAIFLDLQLPAMSGLDLLSWINDSTKFSAIPRFALSAVLAPNDESECIIRGAHGAFEKPMGAGALAAALIGR